MKTFSSSSRTTPLRYLPKHKPMRVFPSYRKWK